MKSSSGGSTPANVVFTTAESFPDGALIELITSMSSAADLQLLYWRNCESRICKYVKRAGKIYRPATLSSSLLRAMRLPGPPGDYGTTRELFDRIVDTIDARVRVTPRDAQLIAAWVFSTWVGDFLSLAPSLHIASPFSPEVSCLLRLLRALCRRGIHVGDLQPAGFTSLPMDLKPTLLMNLAGLPRPLANLIRASNVRGSHVVRSGELIDLHCPKALFLYRNHVDAAVAEGMIRIAVSPGAALQGAFDERAASKVADELQPLLLKYRLHSFPAIVTSDFDVPGVAPGMRELARALGASIVGDPAMQASVVELLERQDEDARAQRQLLPEFAIVRAILAVVHSAILAVVHKREARSISVKELTKQANLSLRSNGELIELTPAEVGYKLASLGLFTRRCAAGKEVKLDRNLSRLIHDLACNLGVPMPEGGFPGCPDCREARDVPEPQRLLHGV